MKMWMSDFYYLGFRQKPINHVKDFVNRVMDAEMESLIEALGREIYLADLNRAFMINALDCLIAELNNNY